MENETQTRKGKTMTTHEPMQIEDLGLNSHIGRTDDSLVMAKRFRVCRTGKTPHVVTVEVSHSGAPQSERCDCRGFQYHGTCAHITAVIESGSLACYPNG